MSLYVKQRCLIVVFEGWDAAGKGGAIKRLTERLDSRGYEVYPIAAPEGEDKITSIFVEILASIETACRKTGSNI